MYHRFDESKYPSTNIQIDVFKEQLNIIDKEGIEFIHPKTNKWMSFNSDLPEGFKNILSLLENLSSWNISFYV